jgi:LPS-assembly lipoprotein
MWWPSQRTADERQRAEKSILSVLLHSRSIARIAFVAAISALSAGCFQPLYSEHAPIGGQNLRQRLSGVDVAQINAPNGTPLARLAVELRNAVLFDLTGGGNPNPPTHRLSIRLSTLRQSVIVDITTARPDVENFGINASYTLTDVRTGKAVMSGTTFARVSYDIPGQEQRFARARGGRDAESRAAKVIADNIRSRLASYFAAGT